MFRKIATPLVDILQASAAVLGDEKSPSKVYHSIMQLRKHILISLAALPPACTGKADFFGYYLRDCL